MIEFAREGIVSKTIIDQPRTKVVLFCMAPGQYLSEHTASFPAVIHILRGQGRVGLGRTSHQVSPGFWVFMPANLIHSVNAEEDLVFLLTLFR